MQARRSQSLLSMSDEEWSVVNEARERVLGMITVTRIRAKNLKKARKSWFHIRSGNPNPYAVIYLEDGQHKRHKSQKTDCKPGTSRLQWNGSFNFPIMKDLADMTMHIQVFHQEAEAMDECTDPFLGCAQFQLAGLFTGEDCYKETETPDFPLEEAPEKFPDTKDITGSIRLAVTWEPTWSAGLGASRAIWATALSSPHVMYCAEVALLGTAGILLLIAWSCRWLCDGPSWSDCKDIPVGGTGSCCFLGATAAFSVLAFRFLGLSGLLAGGWGAKCVTLQDLVEKDRKFDEEQPREARGQGLVHLHLKQSSLSAFEATMSLNLPSILADGSVSFIIRLVVVLLYSLLGGVSSLALGLTWCRKTDDDIFGEASYLDFFAVLCFASSLSASVRRRRILANLQQVAAFVHKKKSNGHGQEEEGYGVTSPASPGMSESTLAKPLLNRSSCHDLSAKSVGSLGKSADFRHHHRRSVLAFYSDEEAIANAGAHQPAFSSKLQTPEPHVELDDEAPTWLSCCGRR